MLIKRLVMFAVFVGSPLFLQAAPKPKSVVQTQWQPTDQLCGQLQLKALRKKQIVVNGKTELRLSVAFLEHATVTLYPATSSEEDCCKARLIATTHSRKYGAFEFTGVHAGAYWLRVQGNELIRRIPVRVTDEFDKKACEDPSVGRSFVVDSSPPKIETRIR